MATAKSNTNDAPARDDRYSRLTRTEYRHSELSSVTAVVVGVGAVGAEVIKHLALLGVGVVVAIDDDVFEPSNLSRSVLFASARSELRVAGVPKVELAEDAVSRWNPDVAFVGIPATVQQAGLGAFLVADIAFSCVDNPGARVFVAAQAARAAVPLVEGGMSARELHHLEVVATDPTAGPCGSVCFDSHLRQLAREQVIPDEFWVRRGCTASATRRRASAPTRGAASISMTASMVASYEVIFGLQRVRDRTGRRARSTARVMRTGAWPLGDQPFDCVERSGCARDECELARQRRVGDIALRARELPVAVLRGDPAEHSLEDVAAAGAAALGVHQGAVEVVVDQGYSAGWRCTACGSGAESAIVSPTANRAACCSSPVREERPEFVSYGVTAPEAVRRCVASTSVGHMGFGSAPGWIVRGVELPDASVRVVCASTHREGARDDR